MHSKYYLCIKDCTKHLTSLMIRISYKESFVMTFIINYNKFWTWTDNYISSIGIFHFIYHIIRHFQNERYILNWESLLMIMHIKPIFIIFLRLSEKTVFLVSNTFLVISMEMIQSNIISICWRLCLRKHVFLSK